MKAKRTCGTERSAQGVEIIYENRIMWNNRDERKIENLSDITCKQFLEEKHIHLSVEKSINQFDVGEKSRVFTFFLEKYFASF